MMCVRVLDDMRSRDREGMYVAARSYQQASPPADVKVLIVKPPFDMLARLMLRARPTISSHVLQGPDILSLHTPEKLSDDRRSTSRRPFSSCGRPPNFQEQSQEKEVSLSNDMPVWNYPMHSNDTHHPKI